MGKTAPVQGRTRWRAVRKKGDNYPLLVRMEMALGHHGQEGKVTLILGWTFPSLKDNLIRIIS